MYKAVKLQDKVCSDFIKTNRPSSRSKQIAEECHVTDFLVSRVEHFNRTVFRPRSLELELKIDDTITTTKKNNVKLDKKSATLLSKYADALIISAFVEPLCEAIELANRYRLRSFKLRLAIEEVRA